MTFLLYATFVLFIVICIFLILLILIQKGRGGGLASAFGGAGGNTAFGSKTGDVLTWATSIVFGVFLLLGVAMNLIANSLNESRTASSQTTVVGGNGPSAPAGGPAGPAVPDDQ